jgi:Flp pilus assembly pilin Flp
MLLLRTTALYVRARFGQLRAKEGGVTAVEYALMVAIVALLMVAGFWLLFSNIRDNFNETADCVENPGTPACPSATTLGP